MSILWYDLIGVLGVGLMVLAYAGLQLSWLNAKGFAYSALNGLGAAMVLLSLVFEFNLPAFLMESVWLALSIYGLAGAWRARAAR